MKPIYEPKGKAKEYGDLAINIYTGCPHRCFYCFAPGVLRRDREVFHQDVRPRENIVQETRKQLEREGITGKLVHLCFTCDPFPMGVKDHTPTRDIIQELKWHGNDVQILTKNGVDAQNVFYLLGEHDWYGVTLDGISDNPHVSSEGERIVSLIEAHRRGIKTWVSFEPVVNAYRVLSMIAEVAPYVDKVKIGKLNYHPSDIDWAWFGKEAENLCKLYNIDYYIKESLRAEMDRGGKS
jgi:DNA repair photolyase